MRVQQNNNAVSGGELRDTWYRPHTTTPRIQWPDAVAYQEAIQNPHGALADADLRAAHVVQDKRALPVAYSGRFAIVFRLKTPDGASWALRCFTSPPASEGDRHLRYLHIARHLESMPDVFVPFRFIDRGIFVGGQWYPVVAMRWANGETLARFVERNLHNPDALRRLAGTLSTLINRLEAAGVAHGDWQHDNLIVANEGRTATLVDYDGMFVPELEGQRGDEVGHPNYQHPARAAEHFGPGLDRFPCLVIQTALLALAHEPSLWSRFSDGESLLFKRADFNDPESSPLFRSLRQIAVRNHDEALADSVARLEDACSHGPDGTLLPSVEATAMVPQTFEKHAFTGQTPSMASRAKWWVDSQGGTAVEAAGTQQRSVSLATPTFAAAARATHQAGTFVFLEKLQHPDLLREERTNLLGARAALAITTVCAALFLASLVGGKTTFPFYLFFWVVNLAGFGYTSWPRKKVMDELNEEIEKMEKQVQNRRDGIRDIREKMGSVANMAGVGSRPDYINDKLGKTPINAVLRVNGTSAATLRQLKDAGITTVLHLQGRVSVPGIPSHVMDALQKWVDELRLEAAAEYRHLALPPQSLPADIQRLEQEMREFERERDRLIEERDHFPDVSWSGYWRQMVGFPAAGPKPSPLP